MTAHPFDKAAQVICDWRKDFGANPNKLRKAFDFWFERFGIDVGVE